MLDNEDVGYEAKSRKDLLEAMKRNEVLKKVQLVQPSLSLLHGQEAPGDSAKARHTESPVSEHPKEEEKQKDSNPSKKRVRFAW